MRIQTVVPDKAQFEVGFRQWVRAVANLTRQIGCRIVLTVPTTPAAPSRQCFRSTAMRINRSYNKMEGYDDFILLSAKIAPDDLLVVVDARRGLHIIHFRDG